MSTGKIVGLINALGGSSSGGGGTPNAVQFVEQTLTEEQQMQARKNLGLYYGEKEELTFIEEQEVRFEYYEQLDVSFSMANTTGVIGNLEKWPESVTIIVNGNDFSITRIENLRYGNPFLNNPAFEDDGTDYFVDLMGGDVLIRGNVPSAVISVRGISEKMHEIPFEYAPTGVKRQERFVYAGETKLSDIVSFSQDEVIVFDNNYWVVESYPTGTFWGNENATVRFIGRDGERELVTFWGNSSGDDAVVTGMTKSILSLPTVGASDNGKLMAVVDGEWKLVSLSELT